MTVRVCLTAGLWLAAVCLAAGPARAERVVLDGVDRYRVTDPLFECVRVVLAHRGETYSPAYVQGVSGAAFRIAGPCPCAPTCSLAMQTAELVRLFGYEAETLSLAGREKDAAAVARVVARVKKEVRAGRAAIVWHAFTNAEWDVVCGFDDGEKQFLGRGSYAGTKDYARADESRVAQCTHICPSGGAILVGRKVRAFDARAAELAALTEAVRHAHSPRDRFLVELSDRPLPWRFREGLACYECWALNFRVQPQRVPNTGDRYCLGIYRSTHRAAAGFLAELADKHPEAKAHLAKAARCFTAEADALDACHKLPGFHWGKKPQPDEKRNARAAALFDKARAAYAEGIGEIDKALAAVAPDRAAGARRAARIRRDGRKVWIDGVRELAFNRGFDCTFAGALAAAVKVTPHPYTYEDLMGLSGLAFRVRWCNEQTKTKWCPSAPVGEMPDEQAAAARLTGWTLPTQWREAKGRDNEALRERIVASIDGGRPVLAYPPVWNMGVIYGYEDGGKVLLMRDYKQPAEQTRVAVGKLGPLFTFLGEHRKPPSMRACLRVALAAAVWNWQRAKHDGGIEGREYWYGDAALAAWIGDLEAFHNLPLRTRERLRALDAWNYTSLHDARSAAVRFLNDWSIVADGAARQALQGAAETYKKETKRLEPLLADKRKDAEAQDGSRAARAREIEALKACRTLESAAIEKLEAALPSLSKERAAAPRKHPAQ